MRWLSPQAPGYDIKEWEARPFHERVKLVCQVWAAQGYGSPLGVYGFYALKLALYVGGWLVSCACAEALGPPGELGRWWSSPEALQRAVLWSVAYESLGLGCGSGPLTGRYLPPVTAFLHFLRPGTVKLPLVSSWSDRRGWLEVALYAGLQGLLWWMLLSARLEPWGLLSVAILLPLLGFLDKTIWLAARSEHYYSALLCMLAPSSMLPGLKLVWLAIWWGAASSKLNRHFPHVVCVMISNSPLPGARWLRRRMYAGFPEDLRPSRLAVWMAHAGTGTELVFPLLLALGEGGALTAVALCIMLMFHGFITGNVPMGVPIEWNVVMVYGGLVLFGGHAGVSVWGVEAWWLWAGLGVLLLVVPVVGHVWPARVSFLSAMRYYAGNWAYSVWLFRGEGAKRLDERVLKAADNVYGQLGRLYDRETIVGVVSRVVAFRHMHLHGRALHGLIPVAVDDVEAYDWYDGELIAGLVLGWNFGEGHLHDEQLLRAVQARCGFEAGELRCVMVESQPLWRPRLAWRVVDAREGELARGEVEVKELLGLDPWPRGARR